MAKTVKCPGCGKQNDKEDANVILIGNRYWCKSCHEKHLEDKRKQEEAKKLEKQKNKENKEKSEAEDYKELIAYICRLYDVKSPSPVIFSQIRHFHDDFNNYYSYKGMKSTLYYFHVIEGNEVLDNQTIGIIPYVYDQAKQFFIDKQRLANQVRSTDMFQMQDNKRIIKKIIRDERTEVNLVDITSITEDPLDFAEEDDG